MLRVTIKVLVLGLGSRSTCIKDFYVRDIGAGDVYIGITFTKGVYIMSAYISSTITTKYLGMRLESS